MTEAKLLWLAGAVLLGFGPNIAILQLSLSDKLEHPVRVAAILNLIYATLAGGTAFFLGAYFHAAVIAVLSVVFLFFIMGQTRWRDYKGIKFGERYIEAMHAVDVATNYALATMEAEAGPRAENALRDTLAHILTEIARVLNLHPEKDDSHLSILVARDGGFKMLCQQGIRPERIPLIEAKFKYGDHAVGIAGKAVSERRTILIPNLARPRDQDAADDWIQVEKGERKEGSIIRVPIFRGIGDGSAKEPLAVLSVTSLRNNAFDSRVVPNMLRRVAAKIEGLIYLLDINNALPGRNPPNSPTSR